MSRAKMVDVDKLRIQLAIMNAEPKITQKELAEKIGMTPQSLTNALTAGRLSETSLSRIAEILDRPAYFFMADYNPEEPQGPLRSNIMREGSPQAFIVDDDKIYFYTDENRYASL